MTAQTYTNESVAVVEITPELIDNLRARGWPVDGHDEGDDDDESEDAVDNKTKQESNRATLEHGIQLLAKRVAEIDDQQKVWWRKLRIIQDKITGSRRDKRIAMRNLVKLQARLAALPEEGS